MGAGRLHVRLRAAAETRIRGGHPWVFSESIREPNRPGTSGELAIIFDRKDEFLAIGLYDPDSPIRVRILHRGKPATIDAGWWRSQFRAALQKRLPLFDDQTTGWRVLHGENDGWPGLVLDRYGSTLVIKLYTAAWFAHLDEVLPVFTEQLAPERILLRLSRNIAGQGPFEDGQVLSGAPVEGKVQFLESGLRFEADVLRGQKTGFFLDQRENRREVEQLARGRDVLNAFSFSGGFSLYAARGGARSVMDLDISEHALAGARRNFALNDDRSVCACDHRMVRADVFDWLKGQQKPAFDLAILDPPSLARQEAERAGALAAYGRLNAAGIRLLRPGGILLAASCSAHVLAEEFYGTVTASAKGSGRRFRELKRTGHPPDHPATFPEAHYLKAVYLQFE